MKYIGLPDFDGNEFIAVLKQYILLEKDWIPNKWDFSLYIRPTAISMEVRSFYHYNTLA